MRKTVVAAVLGAMTTGALVGGCSDDTPPPPRASVPPVNTFTTVAEAPPKPLPLQEPAGMPGSPYLDEPLVVAPPPEQAAFVATYEHVGRPRISLFVNRSLNGNVVATTHEQRSLRVEETRTATGAVTADSGSTPLYDYWGRPVAGSYDHFQTSGPAQVRDRTEIYLAPGEYDDLSARRVDYDAIESVMGDWLHAGGRVTLVSPTLSEGQSKALTDGRTAPLGDLSKNQQIDVLVQVQAKATKQTPQGLAVRLIAEAIDTNSGESLGRAFVDVPPPLEKPVINEYTRFLTRKLMSDMTATWNSPRPMPPVPPAGAPPAATPPAGTPGTPPGSPSPVPPPAVAPPPAEAPPPSMTTPPSTMP